MCPWWPHPGNEYLESSSCFSMYHCLCCICPFWLVGGTRGCVSASGNTDCLKSTTQQICTIVICHSGDPWSEMPSCFIIAKALYLHGKDTRHKPQLKSHWEKEAQKETVYCWPQDFTEEKCLKRKLSMVITLEDVNEIVEHKGQDRNTGPKTILIKWEEENRAPHSHWIAVLPISVIFCPYWLCTQCPTLPYLSLSFWKPRERAAKSSGASREGLVSPFCRWGLDFPSVWLYGFLVE